MQLVERYRSAPTGGMGLRPVRSSLTDREWEVLDLLSGGATTDEIARLLVLSTETVRSHLKNLYRKLEVRDARGGRRGRRAAARARRRRGLIVLHYASSMSPPATLLIWFQLRSPGLAEEFERLMTEDRDVVRGSLDAISDWRLTRPADVPGQSIGQADYVLIAEIVEVERFEQQASEHVQRLTDDLAHLVASRGMLVVRPVL